jgi:hypothetical protein
MPNHIRNILFVTGITKEQMDKIRNHVKLDNNDFAIQAFYPMPEALIKTSSPVKIVSQEEFDRITEKNKNVEEGWKTYPLTKSMQKDLIEEYEYDNWYDWRIAHWGTKWEAYYSEILYDYYHLDEIITSNVEILEHFNVEAKDANLNREQLIIKSLLLSSNYEYKVLARTLHHYKDFPSFKLNENNTLMYKFETAWNTPYLALKRLSSASPDIQFHVVYADEDMGANCGFYTLLNGEKTFSLKFENSFSIESVQYACLVWGYDFDEMFTIENGELKQIDY